MQYNGSQHHLYILKDKLTSFKMKDDESILEMFHRLQVIVNDLKALGEKIKDEDISHRFLMCLPPRHEMLRMRPRAEAAWRVRERARKRAER